MVRGSDGPDRTTFGLMMPIGSDIREYAVVAERRGFDYIACGEHLSFNVNIPNPYVSLAAAGAVTEHIGLLTCISILPLYPAAITCKLVSTLGDLYGRRFNLGVGVGGENPAEFKAAGVPVEERGARADESLDVLRAMSESAFARFRGRFNEIEGVDLGLSESELPPIWIAGRSTSSERRAAAYGDVWMPYFVSPQRLSHSLEKINRARSADGRDDHVAPVSGGIYAYINASDDRTQAIQSCIDVVSDIYGQDASNLRHYMIAGTVDDCIEQLIEYQNAGANRIVLYVAASESERDRTIDLIADSVVGALRD